MNSHGSLMNPLDQICITRCKIQSKTDNGCLHKFWSLSCTSTGAHVRVAGVYPTRLPLETAYRQSDEGQPHLHDTKLSRGCRKTMLEQLPHPQFLLWSLLSL